MDRTMFDVFVNEKFVFSFPSSLILKKWLQANDLQKEVYQHLAYYVPKIYCRGPNPAPQREDMLAQHILLGPMEWYLCGEDPAFGFPKLEQANKPSHLCGRVFKVGEPTYSCRDCAVDPTCVLCMECFLGSIHREHRYRMTTSGGGGFCDCGDTEAWKEGPYCQKHELNTSETAEEEVIEIQASCFKTLLTVYICKSDTYYCMLFNDEVHTYEQVIYTLQKAVNCTQKEAIGFATTVDRDGRRSVRYGDFQYCDQAKSRNTSRQTKPLKVQVMHSSIVAHQSFGLKLLTWLGSVIGYSDGLRRILCQVGLQEGPDGENSSLVDKLMLYDSKLWKGARNVYHQLFMSSLLMDLKYKKLFAIRFARNYERLQSDFMKDDHDRELSIADLSIQIFTVPSLARMLITEENLMTTIIKTFMDHLRHRDIQGRFQFERYTALQAFKFRRVQSLILDLKYVLISKPTEWSDDLRRKFLEGFDAFLELLKCMQGMDPITRQVGQHIEMEPEWEAAFTLQMKLTLVISMMQDWCALDEKVLIEAYKKCLTVLMQCHSGFTDGEQPIVLSMCGHSVETIRYCVSQEKVSIHLPVSRLLAAVRLNRLINILELSPPMLIEHPLRCLVLCAQVHAGMWRRNGFSLVNQIYYYHNVKCRREMFDKDIVMLQTGVSMMDPNHFLMIMLSRFELYQIFSTPDYEKKIKKMFKEKVTFISTGERFSPGIGQVNATDEIKREIIHQLSIRPMAHSELVKALPEDENRETGMESVIEEVACFKKPGLTGRGLYELKPECAKNFNLYFYHFSRAEQSKVTKMTNTQIPLSALPPPALPPFCPLFASLVNILQSDVMLCIMGTILQWAVEHNGYAWSESMLQRVRVFYLKYSRDKDKAERKRKAEIARLRREKIMAQMSEMQRHFINENKELFQQTLEELDTSTSGAHENSPVISDAKLTALGPEQTRVAEPRQVVMCILCQEEQEVKVDSRAMVLAAFIQRSTVLSKNRNKITPDPEKYDPIFMHPDLSCGTHTGSCGHIMHAHCWQRYFDAVQAKEQRRQQRLRVHTSYDVENGEFLCPLCECLSNTVIPLLPPPRVLFNRSQVKALHLLRNEDCASKFEEICLFVCENVTVFMEKTKHFDSAKMELRYNGTSGKNSLNPYSESIKEMLTTFGTATYKVGLKVHPNEEDPRVPIMCWGSCAYTIQTIERILADEDKPLFGHLPCRQVRNKWQSLSELVEKRGTCALLQKCSKVKGLVDPDEKSEVQPNEVIAHERTVLKGLVLSFPAIHCQDFSGVSLGTGDLHLFHLVTMAHIVQILLTSSTGNAIVSTSEEILFCEEISSGWHLWRNLKAGIMPFLRCSALFFHYLNGVPAPSEIQVNGANQFEHLCSYLSLPNNLTCLFQENSEILNTLIESYARESNKLIDLPDDYSCLINQASNFSCPKSGGDKSRAPTLCLVCGTMLCSQSYCCQTELEGEDVGACTAHTYTCGSGVGIFLRVRECQVLFLAGKTKGCFYPPPYLDDYGETDQGLRRGNPLHLCKERFKKIQKLWQQHSITEEIGHAQEANQTLVGIDWQHL
uniref:E3 ubiquitin-protein ligase n=1 Tax=Malurus cyaneus samueli TaxID=2593467 RepID=A0A8C5T9N6_9PASS